MTAPWRWLRRCQVSRCRRGWRRHHRQARLAGERHPLASVSRVLWCVCVCGRVAAGVVVVMIGRGGGGNAACSVTCGRQPLTHADACAPPPPPPRPHQQRAVPLAGNPRVQAEQLLGELLAAEPDGSEPQELLLPSHAHDVAASLIMVLVNTCDSQPMVQVRRAPSLDRAAGAAAAVVAGGGQQPQCQRDARLTPLPSYVPHPCVPSPCTTRGHRRHPTHPCVLPPATATVAARPPPAPRRHSTARWWRRC